MKITALFLSADRVTQSVSRNNGLAEEQSQNEARVKEIHLEAFTKEARSLAFVSFYDVA